MTRFLAVALLLASTLVAAAEVRPLADRVWWLPGTFAPGLQPDGNTVIFEGATGLIVMDTGRHASQRDAILAFARSRKLPIVAIVNSHWHLDHVSGNEAIKEAYPAAKVHASGAIERIIREVWPASTAGLRDYLASGKASAEVAEDIRGDIHAQTHPEPMRPDVRIAQSGTVRIDGIALEVHLSANAATDGDVWVFDPHTRVLASGDLVTLPVPFLDTACVQGWREGLDAIAAQPFGILVPGHGAPMNRDQFTAYRVAFDSFTTCAASATDKAACAKQWIDAMKPDHPRADAMAQYYVDLLRRNGGKSALCRAS